MTAIKVENLGKRYIIDHQKQQGHYRYETLGGALSNCGKQAYNFLRHPFSSLDNTVEHEEFWALKDINFEINQGDRVGIIGRNGAGKSTLLKILSRITAPTTGKITINGRVSSLLEVGTGFHPELTGRENIFLNGAILGMKRQEIRSKFDEIVAFAEVEKFLDTPVKHYSSGMYVRLAFAVAAHLEPEILIVDEVLAVGDAKFQEKCISKMGALGSQGHTIIFVSHNITTTQKLSSTGIWIEDGCIVVQGDIKSVTQEYISSAYSSTQSNIWDGIEGDESITIHGLKIIPDKKEKPYLTTEDIDICINVQVHQQISDAVIAIDFLNLQGTNLAYSAQHDNKYNGLPTLLKPGTYSFNLKIPANTLAEGSYRVVVDIGIHNIKRIVEHASIIFDVQNEDGLGSAFKAKGNRVNNLFRPAWCWSVTELI
jgi:lipopolysaccharide transport system ATP-binding protein